MSKLTILDQPARAAALDRSRMLDSCEKVPISCKDAIDRAENLEVPKETAVSRNIVINYRVPTNVIIAGMGGSAIGGDLLRDWLHDRVSIPISVCRDYVLPRYADEDSLVVAISYSGETEETLSAFLEAVKRRCMIVTISSGGHLLQFSKRLRIPHISIPSDFPAPRAAVAHIFFTLVILARKMDVIDDAKGEIDEALLVLRKVSEQNRLSRPLKLNKAKKIATEIGDTVPIVYGFRHYTAVARRLKCQFNENCKTPSRFDVFPELNHNEIVGWEAKRKLARQFSVILIRDPSEPAEIRQRIEITKRIAKVCPIVEIDVAGREKLARILSAMYIGDFASIYLALLKGIDPTPTKTIASLKEEMKRRNMVTMFEREIRKFSEASRLPSNSVNTI